MEQSRGSGSSPGTGGQLNFDQSTKFQWGREKLFNKWCETTAYPWEVMKLDSCLMTQAKKPIPKI